MCFLDIDSLRVKLVFFTLRVKRVNVFLAVVPKMLRISAFRSRYKHKLDLYMNIKISKNVKRASIVQRRTSSNSNTCGMSLMFAHSFRLIIVQIMKFTMSSRSSRNISYQWIVLMLFPVFYIDIYLLLQAQKIKSLPF